MCIRHLAASRRCLICAPQSLSVSRQHYHSLFPNWETETERFNDMPQITWSAGKWQSLDSHTGLLTSRGHPHPAPPHPCTSLWLQQSWEWRTSQGGAGWGQTGTWERWLCVALAHTSPSPSMARPEVRVVRAAGEPCARGALTCTRASVRSVRRASCSRAYTSG